MFALRAMWVIVNILASVSCIRSSSSGGKETVEKSVDMWLAEKPSGEIEETADWILKTEPFREKLGRQEDADRLSTELLIGLLENIYSNEKDRVEHADLAELFVDILSQRLFTREWTTTEIRAIFSWISKHSSDVFCIKFLKEYIRVIQTGESVDRVHLLVNGAVKFAPEADGLLGKLLIEAKFWLLEYEEAVARLSKSPHVAQPVDIEEVKKMFKKRNYRFGVDLIPLLRSRLTTVEDRKKIRDWIVLSLNDPEINRDVIGNEEILRQMPFSFIVSLLESLYVQPGIVKKDMTFVKNLQSVLADYVRQDDTLSESELKAALNWATAYDQPESSFGLPTSEHFAHACLTALHDTLLKDRNTLAKAVIAVISPVTDGAAWSPLHAVRSAAHMHQQLT